MRAYVDANFLVRLYLELPGCEEAVNWLSTRSGRRAWPCPVTWLLRYEVTNAFQRMVFESRNSHQWRVTPESAAMALDDFEQDLADGQFLAQSPLTLEDIEPEYRSLVMRYTPKHGFRTYDVLHVAAALAMGCNKFLSFDEKAKSLSQARLFENRLTKSVYRAIKVLQKKASWHPMQDMFIIAGMFLASGTLFSVCEQLWPYRPLVYSALLPRDLIALVTVVVLTAIVEWLLAPLRDALQSLRGWSVEDGRMFATAGFVLRLGAFYLLWDFSLYVLHWLMHRNPLWPAHKWHHVPERMWWLAGVRASLLHILLFQTAFFWFWILRLPFWLSAVLAGEYLIRNGWMHLNCTGRWLRYLEYVIVAPRITLFITATNRGSTKATWDRCLRFGIDYSEPMSIRTTLIWMHCNMGSVKRSTRCDWQSVSETAKHNNVPTPRAATVAELPTLGRVLADAFHHDPFHRWVFPSERAWRRGSHRLFTALLQDDLSRSTILTAADRAGVAVWHGPNYASRPWWQELTFNARMLGLIGWRAPLIGHGMSRLARLHPPKPHWYLAHVGTETEAARTGHSIRLLAPVLAICDAEDQAAYLEASCEQNLSFYHRHGFEVVAPFQLPRRPQVWRMCRPPKSEQAVG